MAVVIFALVGAVVGAALLSDFGGLVFGARRRRARGLGRRSRGPRARARAAARRAEERRSACGAGGARARSALASRRRLLRRAAAARRRAPLRRRASRKPSSAAQSPPPRPAARAACRRSERARAAAAAPRDARRDAAAVSSRRPLDARCSRKPGRWFTTGNVPVKVGVVLSLFGVGFLVKEGIDRQWLVLPIELRLMLVALFGIGLLVLGWRLRTRNRAYALPRARRRHRRAVSDDLRVVRALRPAAGRARVRACSSS